MVYLYIIVISFLVTFLITPSVRIFALKFSAVDKRNERKIHRKVISNIGGLAIFMGFLCGFLFASFSDFKFLQDNILSIRGLVLCSMIMVLMGLYDDIQPSNAYLKLLIQLIIVVLALQFGFGLERIRITNTVDIKLGMLTPLITVFWLLGITNAINLLDGLDGLASGVIVVISLFLFVHGFRCNDNFVSFAALALAGSNLAFLRYNFFPAKIFMGDTGSLFMGLTIGLLAIHIPTRGISGNIFFLPAVALLALPILDTTMAVARRFVRRKHLLRGDVSHIHHYFFKKGWSQPKIVTMFYVITFILGLISFII